MAPCSLRSFHRKPQYLLDSVLSRFRLAQNKLARQFGLPLGHRVELWLHGGIRLKGTLSLNEEMLFIPDRLVG